jgi:glycosyltransferase involved in cell wall biosynthesis
MERLANERGLGETFDFIGSVEDQEKWDLFSQADLFVLPSYSESFGQAIAEALSAGVPVITTRATPWSSIESNRCGWWIETGVDALKRALGQATHLDAAELAAMGERGRETVRSNYSWEESASRLLLVMKWLLGQTQKPAWLV